MVTAPVSSGEANYFDFLGISPIVQLLPAHSEHRRGEPFLTGGVSPPAAIPSSRGHWSFSEDFASELADVHCVAVISPCSHLSVQSSYMYACAVPGSMYQLLSSKLATSRVSYRLSAASCGNQSNQPGNYSLSLLSSSASCHVPVRLSTAALLTVG